MAENLSTRSGGYFTRDLADVGDNDKELRFEISTKTNQSSLRKHFTWTCPSLYQVNPGTIKEGTSFDILREFMSRPDQAPQIYSKALSREIKSFQKSCSNLETDQSSSNLSNLGQEEEPNESKKRDKHVSVERSSMQAFSHKVSASLEHLLMQNTEAESLLERGNYR
ncbi:hypothetical protein BY996DRAFT_7177027 [Phakopsora pachyrhizi]|nr:hypothetical protein BY996DRAFT_7177027 [Phakopsora pachyrhizi]